MNIKTLLFTLFLYVALVWVWAAYRHSGTDFAEFGLFWTAVGIAVLLLGLVATRLFYWWKLRRASRPSKPTPSPASVAVRPATAERNPAFENLIAEATAALEKAPGYVPSGKPPLCGMPLYLLVGPEASGKSGIFAKSGLEPRLLAGQSTGGGALLASSGPFSLWLAKNAVFAEISGRAFSDSLITWNQILHALRAERPMPLWKRLWRGSEPGMLLQAVIGFCDVKEFQGTPDISAIEHNSHNWQERLGAIGEIFGCDFPFYLIITKSDTIKYFPEFFRRLSQAETKQVLGCTVSAPEADSQNPRAVLADRQAQRLTKTFRSLYAALASRRVVQLSHEPDPSKRPSIYEFPRELNRIRKPLVQFLSTAFCPNPLRLGPVFLGYYFSGVRQVEMAAAMNAADTRVNWTFVRMGGSDATQVLNAEATRLLSADQVGQRAQAPGASATERLFVADLFANIVTASTPVSQAKSTDPRLELYRRAAFAGTCAVCALLCFAFVWSWVGNRQLVEEAAQAVHQQGSSVDQPPSLEELQTLEALRVQAERLASYSRDNRPLGLRWGLYAGNSIQPKVRESYFRRFQQLILNPVNSAILSDLRGLPSNPAPGEPYEPAYGFLKAHLMISCGCCPADPKFLAPVLKQASERASLASGTAEAALIGRQLDFYAHELPYGNSCHLEEDTAARDHARLYLQNVRGTDRIYNNILATVEATLNKPQRLRDLAPDYASVLSGPDEVSGAFTPEGWRQMEKAAKEADSGTGGESCVTGTTNLGKHVENIELARAIQARYLQDYIEHWRGFLRGLSVTRFNGPDDAARKLQIITDHRSPLLAALAMTANQTYFPATSDTQNYIAQKIPAIGQILGAGKKAASETEKATGEHIPSPQATRPEQITQSFQPVDWVVPPNSEVWVGDKNAPYIEALSQLAQSMEDIARTSANPDQAIHQSASQNYEKAMQAVRQLAQGFKPVGVEGVDAAVQRLLEEPIEHANAFIIKNMGDAEIKKINGQLHVFCGQLKTTTRKYPFSQSSNGDTSLEELANAFAPVTGSVWKFQAQTLGDFTVKEGSQWKAKDPSKKPLVTPELLAFLNRAQGITDAFYPAGTAQAQLAFTLRPKLDSSFNDAILELDIDGRSYPWTTSLQKQFTWPAPPGTGNLGAVARVKAGNLTIPVASRGGLWGVFRIMGDAEPRQLNSRIVEWKYLRGGDGRLEPIQPAPVRIEIVDFPGGHDLFNPIYFDSFQCPALAVQ